MLTEQDLAQIASLIAANNQQLSTMIDVKLDTMEAHLDQKIRHNGVLLEDLQSKVQLIYENQVTIIAHDKRQDDFESTLDNHDIRLFAVEQAIKVV